MFASFTTSRIALAAAGVVLATGAMGWIGLSPAGAAPTAPGGIAREAVPQQGLAAARPAGREWASFAYDPALGELVLFGGDNGHQVFGDTWTRKNGRWTHQHPQHSPSPRTGSAMVYDPATGQLVLFGGSHLIGTAGGFFGDTWVWTGSDWQRLHPATSPPARHNADMIYDGATQHVILFGGYDGHYLGDTWVWNGVTWTQRRTPTAPAPRDTGSFVFDPATGTGVLYGGFNGTTAFTDTWTWNGSWTRQEPATSPSSPTYAWMGAYDAVTGQALLFGRNARTWAWNGATWNELFPDVVPPPRANGSMTDDTSAGQVMLFGGIAGRPGHEAVRNGLWAWNGATWKLLS